MDELLELSSTHGIPIVEDDAHGLGGTYRGRSLGSMGALATLSFHETKNMQCGEGGALLVSDEALFERAEILREKGTNRSRFFRGQVDKYTWVDVGSSYLPSELLAAFLTAQLEAFESIQAGRMAVWRTYATELVEWAEVNGFRMPTVPEESAHPAHLFGMLAPDLDCRRRFIEHLSAHDVKAVFHYVPLHSSPMGRRLAPGTHLPVTDDVSDRLVRLPVYQGLTQAELEQVVEAVRSFVA
jgi:dTDP-4-amino-4,6-dideoxygalactose transaminase